MNTVPDCILASPTGEWREARKCRLAVRFDFTTDEDLENGDSNPGKSKDKLFGLRILDENCSMWEGTMTKTDSFLVEGKQNVKSTTDQDLFDTICSAILNKAPDARAYWRIPSRQATSAASEQGALRILLIADEIWACEMSLTRVSLPESNPSQNSGPLSCFVSFIKEMQERTARTENQVEEKATLLEEFEAERDTRKQLVKEKTDAHEKEKSIMIQNAINLLNEKKEENRRFRSQSVQGMDPLSVTEPQTKRLKTDPS